MTTSDIAGSPVTVTLVDDGDLAIAGLRSLLASYGDRVELLDVRAALAAPKRLDVILYEPIDQSRMGQSLLRDLRAASGARTAVFSWATADQLPVRPTSPCLSKALTASQLVVALEGLAHDRSESDVFDEVVNGLSMPTLREPDRDISSAPSAGEAGVDEVFFDADLVMPLTPRERDVLVRIVGGLSNREISEELELSLNSVKTYVRCAYRKIGVIRRTQAVLWGVRHGLGEMAGA